MSLSTIIRCYCILLLFDFLTTLDGAVGLLLFVRFDDDGDGAIHSIDDLSADATVGDLIAAIKRMKVVNERMWRVEVRYQDTDLMSEHGMHKTLADCGLSMESVVNVLIVPSDTQLMQRFLMNTNAKEKVHSVEEYWDTNCCKWKDGQFFQVECDEQSGRVVWVIMMKFISGKLDVKWLPNSVRKLILGDHGVYFEPIHFQDLSHLSQLNGLMLSHIPIDPASQFHHLPQSLQMIDILDSPTPMHWDFTQLNRYLPNLIDLRLVYVNFVGALNFGDGVPPSLKSIYLSQNSFDAEGADLSALMADGCNLEHFCVQEMKTPGFRQAIGQWLGRLKKVKPQLIIQD